MPDKKQSKHISNYFELIFFMKRVFKSYFRNILFRTIADGQAGAPISLGFRRLNTRGPLAAPHAVLLKNAPIQVRARLILSVAERWALLFRKGRGLQFLCHFFAYSGHALKFLYKNSRPCGIGAPRRSSRPRPRATGCRRQDDYG